MNIARWNLGSAVHRLWPLIPLLLLGACARTERVKLTATVVAYGVEYRGSVVNDYVCARGGRIFGDAGGCNVHGDAGVIPLGAQGFAFLTLQYDKNAVDAVPEDVAYASPSEAPGVSWDVPLEHAPILVRFRDIGDAQSIERIDPAHPDKTPGFVFKSLHGEVTSEPITSGVVAKYLPWFGRAIEEQWGDLYGKRYSDIRLSETLPAHLAATSFERK